MKTNIIQSVRNLAALAAGIIILSGCEANNEPAENGPVAARITTSIAGQGNIDTRAAETAWATGDLIGVSAAPANALGKTRYDNIRYSVNSDGRSFSVVNAAGEDNTIYFQDREPVNFTAYHPYTGTNHTLPGTDGTLARTLTAADQTADALPLIDYLWSSASNVTSSAPQVNFIFTHRMSRLKLNFKEGDGMTFPAAGLTFSLAGLVQEGTFNTLNGTAAANASAAPAALQDIAFAPAAQSSVYPLILWPQAAAGCQLTVTVEGIPFHATINLPLLPGSTTQMGLASGYSYTYNVKVHKTGLEVSSATISGWNDANSGTDVDAKE